MVLLRLKKDVIVRSIILSRLIQPLLGVTVLTDAICRKFFWVGSEADVRGKCMVAWPVVCRPTHLGGLGVRDLKLAGYALQMRCCGYKRPMRKDHGVSFRSRPPLRYRRSSRLPHSRSSATVKARCSRMTNGSMVRPSATLHRASTN